MIGIFIFFLKDFFQKKQPRNSKFWFLSFLVWAILLNMGACIFSNQMLNMGCTRYLLPAFFFLCIFSGILLFERIKNKRLLNFILTVLMILTGINLYHEIKHLPKENFTSTKLEQYLIDHRLLSGYGSYWNAGIVTVQTHNLVNVRAVSSNGDNLIGPSYWMNKKTWYNSKANFLIYDDSNEGRVNSLSAIKTFGVPQQTVNIDKYHILIWNKDITPLLKK